MNNLYEMFLEMQETYKAFEECENEIKKQQDLLKFYKDLQWVCAEMVLGVKEHLIPFGLEDYYKDYLGLGKELKSYKNVEVFNQRGFERLGTKGFMFNKTNLSKIEKFLKGGIDIE